MDFGILICILTTVKVWTSDYRNIKSILVSDFEGYHKGPRFDNAVGSVLGMGVFNSDGDLWK